MKDLLRLIGLFRPYTGWLTAGIGLSVTVLIANISLLALSGWFITAMAIAGLGNGIINYFTPAAVIRGLALLRSGGRYIERLITHEGTFRLLSQLRVWFYEHLEPLAPARLQHFRGGDILSRIRADIDILDNFYLRVVVPSSAAMISVIMVISFLLLYSLQIALINLTGLLLAGLALPLVAHRLGLSPGEKAVNTRSELRSTMTDTVRGMGELQIYQASSRQTERIEHLSNALISQQRRQSHINGFLNALSYLTTQLSMWLIMVIAIPLVTNNLISGPDLAMIILFVLASFETVSSLPPVFQALGETLAAARRIFEIVDAKPAITEPATDAPAPEYFDLRLNHLFMRYVNDATWALHDINLYIPAGSLLGIVGTTGAGKTSLLNVLLRFWDYQEGEIEIGGQPLRSFRSETVRNWCAVVAQQTHLFNTTIRQNLLLACPDATDDMLKNVLYQAQIHGDIMAMPNGLDTFVGETGTRLSSGQARRIAIARALLKDAPILLLDEPTEGLDAASEKAVLEALIPLMHNRTTILISHRPQALSYMDNIVMMRDGCIVQNKIPSNLIQRT